MTNKDEDFAELERRLEVGRGELGHRLRQVWFPEVCRIFGRARLSKGEVGEVHARWLPSHPDYDAALLVVVGAQQWGAYVLQGVVGLIERDEWPESYRPFRSGGDPGAFLMWVPAVRRIPHLFECVRGEGCKCGFGEPFPVASWARPNALVALLELEAMVERLASELVN
jgi:hypothetical protein